MEEGTARSEIEGLDTLIELQKIEADLVRRIKSVGSREALSSSDSQHISNKLEWFFEELPSETFGDELTGAIHEGIVHYTRRTGESWYKSRHAINFLTTEGARARGFLEALTRGRVYINDLSSLNAALRCYSTEWTVSNVAWANRLPMGATRIPLGPAIPPTVYAVAPESERLFYGKNVSGRQAEDSFLSAVLQDCFDDLRWRSGNDCEMIAANQSSTAWRFAFPLDPWRQRYLPYPPVNPVKTLLATLESEEVGHHWTYKAVAALLSELLPSNLPAITVSELRRLAAGDIAPFDRLDRSSRTKLQHRKRGSWEPVWPGRLGTLIDVIGQVIGEDDDEHDPISCTEGYLSADDSKMVREAKHRSRTKDLLFAYFLHKADFRFRFLTLSPYLCVDPVYTRLSKQWQRGEASPMNNYGFSEIYALCAILLQSIGRVLEHPPHLLRCSHCDNVFLKRKRRRPSKNTFCCDGCRTKYHNHLKATRKE